MNIRKLLKAKEVVARFSTEKMPARLSYKFMKFVKKIEDEQNFFDEKVRAIANEYGDRDDNGNLILTDSGFKIAESKYSECDQALAELNALDVNAPDVTFTIGELESINISIQDMIALSDFITEE